MALFDACFSATNPTLSLLPLASFLSNSRHMASQIILRLLVQNVHSVPTTTAAATSVQTASLYSSTEKQNIPNPQNHGNLRENYHFLFFSPCSSLKWKYRVGRAHKSYITAVCKSTWWKMTLFVLWLHNHLYMIVCALYNYGGRGWEYCCKRLCVCRQRAGCIIIHTVV